MPNNKLDILVLLRESSDPRPPACVTVRGAAISERGLRRMPNPADLAALEEALCLKDTRGARVTVLAVGPERLDDTLRLAFSMGADRAVRFWDHGMEGGTPWPTPGFWPASSPSFRRRSSSPVTAWRTGATIRFRPLPRQRPPCPASPPRSRLCPKTSGWRYSARPTGVPGRMSPPRFPAWFSSRKFAHRVILPSKLSPSRYPLT